MQAKIHEAEGYQLETLPLAAARAVVSHQRGVCRVAAQRIESAKGRRAQFPGQLKALAAAPKVYPQRAYLDVLTNAIAPARKLVLGSTNTTEVVILNLEEKVRAGLEDIAVDEPEKKK